MQKQYQSFKEQKAEIVVVFREEQEGAAGLTKAREKSKAEFPFVMDLNAEHTAAYSQDGFSTYIIGQDGEIKVELPGSKMIRPTVDKILAKLEKLGAQAVTN